MEDPLQYFMSPTRSWFRRTYGDPTPPQAMGWLPIQRGEHTLILAPTGSGKTLAAFLWGIDRIYRELVETPSNGAWSAGVRLLYISPLKALSNDIERNLRIPLAGIRTEAASLGLSFPPIRVAVRTGDTPGHLRAAMVKQPPHILITTPESLYLLLTSPRARAMLCTARALIVDEIHTLVGEKRGAHLALSLERLEYLAHQPIQRIGLSATIRPLDEAARFLGGQVRTNGDQQAIPRPVTVVDTGYRKPLDLQVVTVVPDFRDMPADSIWPAVIPRILEDLLRHKSTLVFCNNRRLAERTADRLNAQIAAERSEEVPPGSTAVLAPGGVMRDRGIFAIGAEGPIRAHHGSISREARRNMEEDLKAGRLPALVATSTLELGIDVGAVDLVVQLQSPKSVSQGLQRVGRSGHLVGETSRGRIYATFREDVVEAAAVARGMLDGDVEPVSTPANPLDVLAQHVLAAVSVEEWNAEALYRLYSQAYPYRGLTLRAWESVLAMLSGRFQGSAGPGHDSLRARMVWDRENKRLAPLPGTRLLSVSNAGTIPDTGAFEVYLSDGKTRLGTLDEEFVFETRPGDTFLLGSGVWRVLAVHDDRILVSESHGALPRMPFWRGDYPWRPYELGLRIGRLRREVVAQVHQHAGEPAQIIEWLQREYALDLNSARNLLDYVSRGLDAMGTMSSDESIVVEMFADAVGEARMVVHSPFGGRVNGAWALALADALRERTGIEVETQVNDDGILLRFPGGAFATGIGSADAPGRAALLTIDVGSATEIVTRMPAAEARQRILRELPSSAVFGARFRMNASRALLLPRARGRKRTPFWLQRLKARDLLATVRNLPDFPIVAETIRDCLRDVLDLLHLDQVLSGIEDGRISVVAVETAVPSPLAAGLLHAFTSTYMYEWDAPKAERELRDLALSRELIQDLVEGAASGRMPLRRGTLDAVVAAAEHTLAGHQARTLDELAVVLLEDGDLSEDEIVARCAGPAAAWISLLSAQGRAAHLVLRTARGAEGRWVAAELVQEYTALLAERPGQASGHRKAEAAGQNAEQGFETVLRRFLRHSGPIGRSGILDRYAFPKEWLDTTLGRLVARHNVVQGHFGHPPSLPPQFCDRKLFEELYRRTLTQLRQEVEPASPAAFADFMWRWQGLGADRRASTTALADAMTQLRGLALPAMTWERDILPARVAGYRAGNLDALLHGGGFSWVCAGADPRRVAARFVARGEGGLFLAAPTTDVAPQDEADLIYSYLKAEGASYLADLQAGLGLGPAALRKVLVTLALSGLVTGDGMAALSAVLHGPAESASTRAPVSALAAELAERSSQTHLKRGRPTRQRYHAAKQRIVERMHSVRDAEAGWEGRWGIVARTAIMGRALPPAEQALRLARVALARYGVVTPEVVARTESRWEWAPGDSFPHPPTDMPWEWSEIAVQLQRMELRGEVRRGYFVSGLSGIQYALPEAVEALRAARASLETNSDVTLLSAMDSANVYGGESGGLGSGEDEGKAPVRFARVPSTHVVLWRGRPALVAENNGSRLLASELPSEVLVRSLRAYLTRSGAPRRSAVATWNGAPILGSPGETLLRELGATRAPSGMEIWNITPS